MKGTHNEVGRISRIEDVVITLINIPKFERNSQQGTVKVENMVGCNYFDKYTKIWKELTTSCSYSSV